MKERKGDRGDRKKGRNFHRIFLRAESKLLHILVEQS
jgi:hypothetical protein